MPTGILRKTGLILSRELKCGLVQCVDGGGGGKGVGRDQGLAEVVFGCGDGGGEVVAVGEAGCDGGGECATGAVGGGDGEPWSVEPMGASLVDENIVGRVAGEVSAFDEDRDAEAFGKFESGAFHGGWIGYFMFQQRLRFGYVGCGKGGDWQKVVKVGGDSVGF